VNTTVHKRIALPRQENATKKIVEKGGGTKQLNPTIIDGVFYVI
jgi:hypothetical protein